MSFFSFILYPRLQRLAKDLLKQLQVQDSGSWASNKVSALDRTLGEVARILEKEVCNSSLASGHNLYVSFLLTSLVSQVVKRLPTMWETRVQSLGQEDLLEKEMATHSSILAWKIPWTEEPGRLQSMGSKRVRPD